MKGKEISPQAIKFLNGFVAELAPLGQSLTVYKTTQADQLGEHLDFYAISIFGEDEAFPLGVYNIPILEVEFCPNEIELGKLHAKVFLAKLSNRLNRIKNDQQYSN